MFGGGSKLSSLTIAAKSVPARIAIAKTRPAQDGFGTLAEYSIRSSGLLCFPRATSFRHSECRPLGSPGSQELNNLIDIGAVRVGTQRMRGFREDEDDPMLSVASSLVDIGEALKGGLNLKWDMAEE